MIGKYIIDKVKILLLVGATSEKIKEAVIKEAEKEEIDLDDVQVELEKIDEEDKKVTEELNKYLRELGLKELK